MRVVARAGRPGGGLAGDPGRRLRNGLAGAAVLIGLLTVLARIAGFGRTVVFSQTVTSSCLGQAYFTANQVPNIIFEIVAGGALTSMVVPVLAGPAERDAREDVRRTASALLTWVVAVLTPLSLAAALAARPVMELLVRGDVRGCGRDGVVAVGARMLVVFAPQIILYGLAVVLYGVLQAHRRFTAPALAPLVSSLVVIGTYVAYVPLGDGREDDLARLPREAELMLSVGTTAGVVTLLGTAVIAVLRLRLRIRPTLRFPPGAAARVRRLALAGLAAVVAQQAATLAVVMLSAQGTRGALADYNYAWAIFLLPWAILAVPIATSAFPALSARTGAAFDAITARTTRAVVLVSSAGVAALVGVAAPVAAFLDHRADPVVLSRAIVAFAPGLLGYGLVAHLGRALYASGNGRASAASVVTGWLAVVVADVALVLTVPRDWVVAALAAGNSAGMTLAGALLVAALLRSRGRAAASGLARAAAAGGAGAAAGAAAGLAVSAALRDAGPAAGVGVAGLAALAAGAVFLVVVYLVDGRDVRAVLKPGGTVRGSGMGAEEAGDD